MERYELENCISIAKRRFSDRYYPEAARTWADMDYDDVKEFLEYVSPESIKLHGLDRKAIMNWIKRMREEERKQNFFQYGLRMTDAELEENKELFIEAQKAVNNKVFGIECTDEELLTKFWTEVKMKIQEGEK